jgi:hypothetical protein
MQFLQSIDWTMPTWDLFIVIFFVIAAFLYGLSLGKDRVIVILVSIYMALAVINTAPYLNDLSGKDINIDFGHNFAFKVTLFLGVFIALFFLLSRSALSRAFGSSGGGSWWQVILFSFLHIGLLISVILSFLPFQTAEHLMPITRQIFTSDLGKFLWITTPIVAMVVFKGGSNRGRPPLVD